MVNLIDLIGNQRGIDFRRKYSNSELFLLNREFTEWVLKAYDTPPHH